MSRWHSQTLLKPTSNRQKSEIICEKHGSFLQSPNKHLSGNGCPKCKNSNSEK